MKRLVTEVYVDGDWWLPIVEEAKEKLRAMGIILDGVFFELGRNRHIGFRSVSIDLKNSQLLSWLQSASGEWEKAIRVLSMLRLMDEEASIGDYVWVEDVTWNEHGVYVRVFVSRDMDELLEEFGYADLDVQEMEETLEGLLKCEADDILKSLEKEYWSQFKGA